MTITENLSEALIVIDTQNDFCAGGALAVGDDNSFIANINNLMDGYQTIIFTQDWHPIDHISFAASHRYKRLYDRIPTSYGTQILWPKHCVAGTKGAAFHPDLKTNRAELILHKGTDKDCDSYSAFSDAKGRLTGLGGFLHQRGITHLTFCGLTTDFCVAASALDAIELNFKVRVALAACQALDINGSYDNALTKMQEKGVELGLFS